MATKGEPYNEPADEAPGKPGQGVMQAAGATVKPFGGSTVDSSDYGKWSSKLSELCAEVGTLTKTLEQLSQSSDQIKKQWQDFLRQAAVEFNELLKKTASQYQQLTDQCRSFLANIQGLQNQLRINLQEFAQVPDKVRETVEIVQEGLKNSEAQLKDFHRGIDILVLLQDLHEWKKSTDSLGSSESCRAKAAAKLPELIWHIESSCNSYARMDQDSASEIQRDATSNAVSQKAENKQDPADVVKAIYTYTKQWCDEVGLEWLPYATSSVFNYDEHDIDHYEDTSNRSFDQRIANVLSHGYRYRDEPKLCKKARVVVYRCTK
jgi:molecular chaperone GrpE (heat shock protein)